MANRWTTYNLNDIADIGSSKRIKMADYVSEGVPFYRSKEIIEKNKGNDISTELFITEDQFNTIESKFGAPKELDILLTSVGTLGVPYQVQKGEKFYFKDGNLTWFRNFKDFVNPRYIYFWLTSPVAKRKIDEVTIGSTQQALTIVALKSLTIELPSLDIQNLIVEHLEALSGKIKLSRQTNQTLEQMAQTLFKSWFVDFAPVIDNALAAGTNVSDFPEALQQRAEQRKQAHQLPDFKALPDDIRALFPSDFEQREFGWIPKGWSVVELSEITTELRRGISPKYIEEGGIQVINQKCIRNHEVNFSLCRRNNPELRKVIGRELLLGDVLVNSTGVGTLGRMAQVNSLPEPTVVDSHVTVVRPDIIKCPAYTFGQLMLANERRVEALGEGSTGQTELSRKILSEQKIVLPPVAIASHIEGTLKSYAEKQISNSIQIATLAKLRDTLLPKLISGEITINKEVA